MGGHDYNTVLSVTTAGMAISQIPHGLIIQKIKPRIWLPTMVVVWGCLTVRHLFLLDHTHSRPP